MLLFYKQYLPELVLLVGFEPNSVYICHRFPSRFPIVNMLKVSYSPLTTPQPTYKLLSEMFDYFYCICLVSI